MNDPAFVKLLAALPQNNQTRFLIVLEENCQPDDITQLCNQLSRYPDCYLISNRFELAGFCQQQGVACHFSDLDFSHIAPLSLDALYFRVAKEKAVTHRVINAAAKLLKPDRQLQLFGARQEGIKTFINKAGELFNDNCRAKKNGAIYHACITKNGESETLLDDKDYRTLRNISPRHQPVIFSKPGLFGWNKIDQGSALLAQHFSELLPESSGTISDWLDLGCGYGYLSLQAQWHADKLGSGLHLVATDNNAAAMIACKKNFAEHHIDGRVVASDCAQQIVEKFDVVISHPPFHRGFRADKLLGNKFVASAREHLRPGGKALMVANSFIPLETLASEYFDNIRLVENNGQFKVVMMS